MTPFPQNIATNREFLNAYINAILSNIRLAVLNRNCKIIWVNERFCKLTRFSENELIGRSIEELNLICHGPEFFREVLSTISKGLKWSGEIKSQSKDGGILWVNTNILPIKNNQGDVESYLVLNSNITPTKYALAEKEKAVEKLLRSEARYRALLENQSDLIWLCDAKGYCVYVNKSYCDFTGKTYDNLIGASIKDLSLPGLPAPMTHHPFKLTPDSPEFSNISRVKNYRNKKFWISFRMKGIFDIAGNLFEVLTIGRDVTTLKNAELQKSNYINDLEHIAFMTSHNVRSPIATMLGFIELMKLKAIETNDWNFILEKLKKCIIDLDIYTREMSKFVHERQSA